MVDLLHSTIVEPKRSIVYVHPDVSVRQAVEMMVRDNIGALVVTDDVNLLGIISERDIIRNLVHKGLSSDKTTVSEIMCANVSVLNPTDTIEKAMQVITETKRRHVLIAEQGKPIAMISIGDILFHLLENKMKIIEQLENYIHTY